MVEISTSILSVEKGKEIETFLKLEAAKTDYFHIDVMDGKFVEKNTYSKMLEYASYIKRISNLPLDVHLMVENVKEAISEFNPYAIDLSSSLETDGFKDENKIKELVEVIN